MKEKKILFGIWSLSTAKMVEPIISLLRSNGYESILFVLQSHAIDFLSELGHQVIDVARKSSGSRHWPDIREEQTFEYRADQVLRKLGGPPEWNLDEVRQAAATTREELSRISPDGVAGIVLWGGRLSFQRIMSRFADEHQLPVILMERGHFPGTLIIDEFELDENTEFRTLIWPHFAHTQSAATLEKGQQLCNELISKRNTLEAQSAAPKNKRQFFEHLGLEPTEKLVFLPLQVPIDTNMIYRTFEISGNESLVTTACEAVQGFDQVTILVKFHPGDRWTNKKKFSSKFPGVRIVEGIHVHDIIRHADVVVTINSQVGIEAILNGKPVITCGRSHFGGLVNRYHVKTKPDLISAIQTSLEKPVPTPEAERNKFMYALRQIYLVDNPHSAAHRISMKIETNNQKRRIVSSGHGLPPLRIAIATGSSDSLNQPTARQRIEPLRQALEEYGTVELLTAQTMLSQTWDIVWATTPAELVKMKQTLPRVGCVILDISEDLATLQNHSESLRDTLWQPDLTVFSTEYLENRYGHLTKKSFVLPDGLAPAPIESHSSQRDLKSIVWMGRANELGNIYAIGGEIKKIQQQRGIHLHLLVSEEDDEFDPNDACGSKQIELKAEFHPWNDKTQVQVLAGSSIGLAPSETSAPSMAQSASKLLTFQAAGLCVVAQAGIPSYEAHIVHGENGLLAITPEDYKHAIEYLFDFPNEIQRMRIIGQSTLEDFSNSRQQTLFRIIFKAFEVSSKRHYRREIS